AGQDHGDAARPGGADNAAGAVAHRGHARLAGVADAGGPAQAAGRQAGARPVRLPDEQGGEVSPRGSPSRGSTKRGAARLAARAFRELLGRPGVIRSLGAHDVFTARLIESAGLETVFLGGFGTSASLLGLPDVGFITLTEMADAVRRMAMRVRIPV